MKGLRVFRRLRPRSPVWVAILLLLLPYFPLLIHWVTSPWRPEWYHVPAEMVGDQTWVEGTPWPPNLKRDKVLVHNIWGTRIVDRSVFAKTPINADLPTAPETIGVQPIFAGPSEWAPELRDWNLEPAYFHRYSRSDVYKLESVTLEALWMNTVGDDAVLADLGVSKLPWKGLGSDGLSPTDRPISILFRVLDPEARPEFDEATIRDAVTGQVVAESLPAEFVPTSNPPRVYMLLSFKMDWLHRRPKILCLEKANSRLALHLPAPLFGDAQTKMEQSPPDVSDLSMSLHRDKFVSRDELGSYIGANVGSIWGYPIGPWFAPRTDSIFTIRDAMAQYFELNPEVDIIQLGDFVRTVNVWSVLKLEDRKTAALLQYVYDPDKQKKVLLLLWGIWAGWLVLQFFFLRRFLRGRGYIGIGWLKTMPLLLEFGRCSRTLPHAHEIAVIPGVDIASWRSLRRFVIDQAGRK